MTTRRTFTAAEITKILGNEIQDADKDFSIDLGNGLRAEISAHNYKALKKGEQPDYNFFLNTEGKSQRTLEQATQEELEKISAFIWEKIAPQFQDSSEALDELLMPDWQKEKTDSELEARRAKMTPEERRVDDLMPDELRDKPDNPDLESDPSGLVPDWARQTKADAARKRRIADGKATVEDLLMPESLKGDD